MRPAIVSAAALLAGLASAQTVIDVLQDSDGFPTVGQVDCMEPVNGKRCAATYECGDQAGALWRDMASNDGSRAINAASQVATGQLLIDIRTTHIRRSDRFLGGEGVPEDPQHPNIKAKERESLHLADMDRLGAPFPRVQR